MRLAALAAVLVLGSGVVAETASDPLYDEGTSTYPLGGPPLSVCHSGYADIASVSLTSTATTFAVGITSRDRDGVPECAGLPSFEGSGTQEMRVTFAGWPEGFFEVRDGVGGCGSAYIVVGGPARGCLGTVLIVGDTFSWTMPRTGSATTWEGVPFSWDVSGSANLDARTLLFVYASEPSASPVPFQVPVFVLRDAAQVSGVV